MVDVGKMDSEELRCAINKEVSFLDVLFEIEGALVQGTKEDALNYVMNAIEYYKNKDTYQYYNNIDTNTYYKE